MIAMNEIPISGCLTVSNPAFETVRRKSLDLRAASKCSSGLQSLCRDSILRSNFMARSRVRFRLFFV